MGFLPLPCHNPPRQRESAPKPPRVAANLPGESSRFRHPRSHFVRSAEANIQTACKPGSVHALRRWTAIPLGRMSPPASSNQPGRQAGNRPTPMVSHGAGRPYSVLLPVGFALPSLLPARRCALTAPFHPCPGRTQGGLFSVALSLGSPPPAVSRHRISVEPGLSSSRILLPPAAVQPSGFLLPTPWGQSG